VGSSLTWETKDAAVVVKQKNVVVGKEAWRHLYLAPKPSSMMSDGLVGRSYSLLSLLVVT
jgi:hypothetical protein